MDEEKKPALDKIPPIIWLVVTFFGPVLTQAFTAQNIDNNTRFWLILSISLPVCIILGFAIYFDHKQKIMKDTMVIEKNKNDKDVKIKELECNRDMQKNELDANTKMTSTQIPALAKIFKDMDPDAFERLIALSKKFKSEQDASKKE